MALEDESLEALFDQWKAILKTNPSAADREEMKAIHSYTLRDKDYPEKRDDPAYFKRWYDQLPAYYQHKADVMLAILTRLKANRPMQWIVSEISEDIPQLAYFLFARHLELFVLKDPLRLQQIQITGSNQHKPEWLWKLLQKGVTLEEIDLLARRVAQDVVGSVLAVTDGYGSYGDLPRNTPRPRLVEAEVERDQRPRYLDGVHEYLDDSVLQALKQAPKDE